MSNQDNINSFLDIMDFDSTPAEQAPSPQSVPFTPAAVWPGEEPAQQTAAAAPVQAEPVPAAPPTAQPAAPQEVIPTPAPAVQTPQIPQAAPAVQQQTVPQQQPAIQQQVITQAQPIVQQQVMPQQQPVVQEQVIPQAQQVVPQVQPAAQQQPVAQTQPVMQPAAPNPAPVQETMLDQFDTVMQNLEVQGEKRMLEALAAKPAIFSYAKVKENIEDRDSTFEDLRQKYEADFPELSDPKTISWTVNYGKTTKSVSNPGSDKVYDIKAEIENSKAFKEALKKAKTDADKNPECIVKLFKKAQTKGEALSGIKELCLTKAEAAQTNKPIVLLPSKDGRVYEQRRNEIGCFTAPAENVREFEDIRAEFKMALPKIPAHIFSKVMGFFKSISDELHYEVLVHILYDTEEKEYIIKVPKQRISEASVNSETDEPYPDRYIHVMDFHSHNTMPAVFSGTDNADEKETRLYAVAGRFNRTFPEITVRAGCAGKFIPLNPEDVFEGDFFGSYPEEWKENIRHWGTEIKKPWHMSLRLKRTFGEGKI